ncbi:membrane protein insertase YidC [Legionella erythra]|uniref:Membrane protein insertase YidC n=1 Tax=Legionella erythra TaxID=448 RepID=A0A0W0TGF5_LEGER|nr:membrane protein insertase YidC [Legionella erythra]KTC94643.1 cytoplasmic insertase into membrane protein, Sec system [Legionella erythra]
MDTRRVILYAALALIVYSLWTSWHQDYPGIPATQPQTQGISNEHQLLPDVDTGSSSENQNPKEALITPDASAKKTHAGNVRVKTDVLDIQIDTEHGDIVNARLLDYPASVEEKNNPITLLNNNPDERYVANSNLLVSSTKGVLPVDLNFTSQESVYQLENNQKTLRVVLTGKSASGLDVKKIFEFTRGSYLIQVNYQIANESNADWQGYLNAQLLRDSPKEDQSSIFHVGSYVGASYSVPGQHKYQKVTFKDMAKSNLNTDSTGGWVAMQQHYFLSAWVPDASSKNVIYTRSADNNYTIGVVSSPITIKPGDSKTIGAKLYVGPEITHVLQTIAPGLDLTVDYGWLWFLSSALFAVMKAIHGVVGNWGWSIVLVTLLIKLAFYRLSASSYRSMAGMRQLQPKLQALRERYGDDKAKMSQATMELYRQEKVNPLGGCLPILVQIPVFIALYWVLLESVELRQAPFILWINDLAAADPYHILPIIMGGTMLIQQRLNPAPPDPMQAKIMMFLPVLFTVLFWNFPAGLVLYWIVNNTLSILQQWHITRKYSDDKPSQKKLATAK